MSTTTTTKPSEYLQPSSINSYDSSQSPLALLAQTCSSIGKDSSLSPPTITSFVTKSSLSNSDKSFSLTKNSTLSQSNHSNSNKKSTLSLKTKPISLSSSFIERNIYPPQFDPTILFLRSSLAYLSSQQHSYSTICTIPGCLQCETIRQILSNSINPPQPYYCHWKTCQAKFPSNEQLIEHIRYDHRSTKTSNYHRFHPYFKPTNASNLNDQLPFFYPRLSMSLMSETKRPLNNNNSEDNN